MRRFLMLAAVGAGVGWWSWSAGAADTNAMPASKAWLLDPAAVKARMPSAQPVDLSPERRAELENKLKEVADQLNAVETEAAGYRETMTTLYKAQREFVSNISTQNEDFVKLKKEMDEAEARVRELRAEYQKKLEAVPAFQEQVSAMTNAAAKMNAVIEKKKALQMEKSRLSAEIWRINTLEKQAKEKAEGAEGQPKPQGGQPAKDAPPAATQKQDAQP
jgi:DNA repair exonuclease SbcCD ATPase subunit